jgi:hypothetical protein
MSFNSPSSLSSILTIIFEGLIVTLKKFVFSISREALRPKTLFSIVGRTSFIEVTFTASLKEHAEINKKIIVKIAMNRKEIKELSLSIRTKIMNKWVELNHS